MHLGEFLLKGLAQNPSLFNFSSSSPELKAAPILHLKFEINPVLPQLTRVLNNLTALNFCNFELRQPVRPGYLQPNLYL